MYLRRPLCALLILISGLFGLVACSKKESSNSIAIYTSLDESIAKILLENFTKETGIRVNFVRLATGEAAARIEAEKNRPQASLWLGGVGLGHAELKSKGLTTPYSSPSTQAIPGNLKDPEGYWNGLYKGILVFVTNENQTTTKKLVAPTSWNDLLDTKWKGLIQIPNPGTSGTSFNLITTLIQSMGEEKAFEYMRDLHKNVSQYTKSGAAPTKNVALGESTLAIGYFHDIVRLAQESKAPLKVSFPKEGTGYEIAAVSLVKNAPNPELAGKLIDWMYSKSASQILADHYYVPISLDGVILRNEAVLPKDLKLIDTNVDWAGKNKERLIDLWNSKINT